MSHIAYSDFIPVNEVTSLLDVTASLPDSPTLTTNVSVLGCVGIELSRGLQEITTYSMQVMQWKFRKYSN